MSWSAAIAGAIVDLLTAMVSIPVIERELDSADLWHLLLEWNM